MSLHNEPTPSSIKALLDVGVNVEDVINSEHIYDYIRPRKTYPSIEIEMSKPPGKFETQAKSDTTYTMLVHIYYKQLGVGTDDIKTLEIIEGQVVTTLTNATLGDHKVINETFTWNRQQIDKNHPYFYRSTLSISILQMNEVDLSQRQPDGVLTWQKSGSTIDNPPVADTHQYINVFDVELAEGYRDIEEIVTNNPEGSHIAVHYAARFVGRFIANFYIKYPDVGATGEMLNHMSHILTNGEKPEFQFIYTNHGSKSPNPGVLTETFTVHVDELQRMYMTEQLSRWRIIGKIDKPGTITLITDV